MKKIIFSAMMFCAATSTLVSCKKDKNEKLENRVENCQKASEKVGERALAFAEAPTEANCEAFKAACLDAIEKCDSGVSEIQKKQWREAANQSCD